MGDFINHHLGANDHKVVVNALPLDHVPFEGPDQSTPTAQMSR
jgi:hypothetical protein